MLHLLSCGTSLRGHIDTLVLVHALLSIHMICMAQPRLFTRMTSQLEILN